MDLPDPQPSPPLNEVQLEVRQWHLGLTLAAFGTAYALLHKILLPVALSLLGTSRPDYARIDIAALLYLAFALWLHFKQYLGWQGSLMIGLLLAHALSESFQLATSSHSAGWLAFSKMISAWPLALTGTWMLSMPQRLPSLRVFFAALLAGILLALTLAQFRSKASEPSTVMAPRTQESGTPPPATPQPAAPQPAAPQPAAPQPAAPQPAAPPPCGATEMRVSAQAAPAHTGPIVIRDCGFSPNISRLRSEHEIVEIHNQTDHSQTIRYVVFTKQGRNSRWNTVLPKNEKRRLKVSLAADQIGVIISDAAARFGMTLLVGDKVSGEWIITRTPLRAEALPAADSGLDPPPTSTSTPEDKFR